MIIHRKAVKVYWVTGSKGKAIRREMLDQRISRKRRWDHNPPCGLPGTRKQRRALARS